MPARLIASNLFLMETWDIWYPNGGAQGLQFARARIEPQGVVWVHAAPDALRVEVRDDDGRRLAFAEHLKRAGPYLPMTRLLRDEESVTRSDGWPQSADIGRVVVLAGGEAGMLLSWWNSAAGDEWRWSVEFYNRRG